MSSAATRRQREIEFLYWEGCPSYPEARELLERVLDFFEVDANIVTTEITTQGDAERHSFPGSPTIRIEGRDVDPAGKDGRPSLGCRIYTRPGGQVSPLPSEQQLQAALRLSLPIGSTLPAFTLPGVDGRTHSEADYADADALIVVQACNHCPFVQAWEGRLNAIADAYRSRGVRVVAICSNDADNYPEDSFEEMRKRATEQGFVYDYLHDEDQTVVRALGATRTPEVFVFDRDRSLVYHGAIDDNHDEAGVTRTYLRDALEALLAGDEVAVSETPPVGCFVKWIPAAPASVERT